jgi:hypothetical protein
MTTSRTDLFVSYARGDSERVAPIVQLIADSEFQAQLDTELLEGGTDYGAEIVKAIQASRAVLVMLSGASVASRNVRQEIKVAWDANRPLIPIRLESVSVPDDLKYWLEGVQYLDQWDPAFEQKLLGAIRNQGTLHRDPPKRLARLLFRAGLGLLVLAACVIGLVVWSNHEKERTLQAYAPFVNTLQQLQRSAQDLRDQWRALSKVRLTTPEAHRGIVDAQRRYYQRLNALDEARNHHVASLARNRDSTLEQALQRVRDAAFDELHDQGLRRFDDVGALINRLEENPQPGDDAEARKLLAQRLESADRQIEVFGEKVGEYVEAFSRVRGFSR